MIISFTIAPLLLPFFPVVPSEYVGAGGIIVVFGAVETRDFNGFPARRFVDGVLELVEKLEVRLPIVNALEELFLFYVVT